MIKVENTPRYREIEREKARRRNVARTAEILATKLRIAPHERGLVWCLGSGEERSNLEALRTWVDARVGEGGGPDPWRLVDELAKELHAEFGDPAWS